MILCYTRYCASAVPFQGIGMTSPLSGAAWAYVKRWGSLGKAYAGISGDQWEG